MLTGLLLLCSGGAGGCATRPIKLYVLENGLKPLAAGQMFTAPTNGYFVSEEYFELVLDARVEK